MYVDAVMVNDDIVSWVRKDDGKLVKLVEPAPLYVYVNDELGTETNLFGGKVSKQTFSDYKSYYSFVENTHHYDMWEGDVSPVYKFLSDNFYKYKPSNLNIGFFDIEVDYNLKYDSVGFV